MSVACLARRVPAVGSARFSNPVDPWLLRLAYTVCISHYHVSSIHIVHGRRQPATPCPTHGPVAPHGPRRRRCVCACVSMAGGSPRSVIDSTSATANGISLISSVFLYEPSSRGRGREVSCGSTGAPPAPRRAARRGRRQLSRRPRRPSGPACCDADARWLGNPIRDGLAIRSAIARTLIAKNENADARRSRYYAPRRAAHTSCPPPPSTADDAYEIQPARPPCEAARLASRAGFHQRAQQHTRLQSHAPVSRTRPQSGRGRWGSPRAARRWRRRQPRGGACWAAAGGAGQAPRRAAPPRRRAS